MWLVTPASYPTAPPRPIPCLLQAAFKAMGASSSSDVLDSDRLRKMFDADRCESFAC